MGPAKYNGPFGEAQLMHLLRRTLFGVTKEEVLGFSPLSLDEVVDVLLTPTDFSDTLPVNNYDAEIKDPEVAKGEVWVQKRVGWKIDVANANDIVVGRLNSLRTWLIKNIVNQPPRFQFKLLLFWHNHFANEINSVFTGKMAFQYFRTLWLFSYGNFKDIIKALTVEPHMLSYLNGNNNVKDAPDENFARELQELYCIGKGPNSKYTEGDVQAAARILTGWAINWETIVSEGEAKHIFWAGNHDETDKTFSAFYGNRVISGKSGQQGQEETIELVDMLVEHPECARFICRKLHAFFIDGNITEAIEEEFIEPLAELFIASNFEIQPVLRAFFTSEHFFKEDNRGGMIKSPADSVFGFWRSVGINKVSSEFSLDQDYYTFLFMHFYMNGMGFSITEPPNVAGWPAYYQAPSYDKIWVTTNTLINRIIITDSSIYGGLWTPIGRVPWDLLAYTATMEDPSTPDSLIEEVVKLNFTNDIKSSTKMVLKSILLSGQQADYYWTVAWDEYIDNPEDEMKRSVVEQRLRYFYLILFQLPEYQLF